ncbi:MAG: hypothetical protein CSA18_01940 [Deltaproteobacteria bacterium]|nr:MAG: hypothetical protein CSA18_01940 [Deltaproteobacteria bacterium]
MNKFFSRKHVQSIFLIIIVFCIFFTVGLLVFTGEKTNVTAVKDKAVSENTRVNKRGEEKSKNQTAFNINKRSTSAAADFKSAKTRKITGIKKTKLEIWGNYAEINKLITNGNWDKILGMVEKGEFGVNQPVNPAKMTLIEIAIRQEGLMDIVRKLYNLGANLTPPGRNLVQIVCSSGNLEGLRFLQEHGVEITDDVGRKGLLSAIISDNINIMNYLVETMGINPSAAKNNNFDALSSSINIKTGGRSFRRLIELGFEIKDNHIYQIARSGNMELVDILLENDIDIKNIKIDQHRLTLQNPVLKNLADNGLYPWPDLVMEGDSFMDAVINSDETDIAFLKWAGTKPGSIGTNPGNCRKVWETNHCL